MGERIRFVMQLPEEVQNEIRIKLRGALEAEGYTGKELEGYVQDGMDSKLVDLEDTINIEPYREYIGKRI